ncbi:MAG: N-acetylmuramoyl-L-alanine amidase [Campylobacterota bacterium]|nr:N-acetylmuramoyl-L-alanine amidase [Campylobacterota bacterium]
MFRSLFLLFIFAFTLQALNNDAILKRANTLIKSDDKSKQFRAYNDYKNLYLRSIMSDNEKLKISSLKGIVKSGKKLHIDIAQYSNELSSVKTTTKKVQKIEQKIKKEQNFRVKSSHILKSAKWQDDTLVLSFDKKLEANKINYFTLFDEKKRRYKYVFDIKTSEIKRAQNIRKSNILRVRLAQYKSNVLRLVIEHDKLLKISHSINFNKLQVTAFSQKRKKSSPKVEQEKSSYISKYMTPKRLDRNKVIVIDAGHGGKDPGAVGYRKYREKVVVVDVAKKLRDILKSRGYRVYMTRDSDKFVKLSDRTKYANKKRADIFISIHANAVAKKNADKVHGVECYFLSKSRSNRAKKVAEKENSADLSDLNFYGKESFLNTLGSHNMVASNKLAIDLQRGMLGSLKKNYNNIHDGGVREGPFWVLIGAQMPSVLVEIGFITNPREARRLVSNRYQKRLATGLANGIERYFLNN